MNRFKTAFGFLLTCVLLWTQTMLAVSSVVVSQEPVCGCCQQMDCCVASPAPSAPNSPVTPARTEATREVAAPSTLPSVTSHDVLPDATPVASAAIHVVSARPLPALPIYERTCSYLI